MWMDYIFYCSFFNLCCRSSWRKKTIYLCLFCKVDTILRLLRVISLAFWSDKWPRFFYSKSIVYIRTLEILLSTLKPRSIQTSNKLMSLGLLIFFFLLRGNYLHKLSNIDIFRLMILEMMLLSLMISRCYLPVRISNLRLNSLDWKTSLCPLL